MCEIGDKFLEYSHQPSRTYGLLVTYMAAPYSIFDFLEPGFDAQLVFCLSKVSMQPLPIWWEVSEWLERAIPALSTKPCHPGRGWETLR